MEKNKISLEEDNNISVTEPDRQARLHAIREAIAAGTYRLDIRRLADSLLKDLVQEHWLEMQLKKRSIKPLD